MKKILLICSILATINLQAWSCFDTPEPKTTSAPVAKPRPIAPTAALDTSSTTIGDVLTAVGDPIPGAGRGVFYITYSHDGQFAAVTNDIEGTASVFKVDGSSGEFTPIQTIETGPVCVCVGYSPCDEFAVAVNADGGDPDASVIIYKVNGKTGEWSPIQTIVTPEVLFPFFAAYSPDGRFLAVANAGTFPNFLTDTYISMYRVHPTTGHVALIGQFTTTFPTEAGQNTLAFSPDGKFIAVVSYLGSTVSIYQVDQVTGFLTQISGSPFPVIGFHPQGIAYQHNGEYLAIGSGGAPNVTVYKVDLTTGALGSVQYIDTSSFNPNVAYIAFSDDDTLALIGSFGGNALVYCVVDGIWCSTPVQIVPGEDDIGVAFAPCSDFAAVTTNGTTTVPGSTQVYRVDNDACPNCP